MAFPDMQHGWRFHRGVEPASEQHQGIRGDGHEHHAEPRGSEDPGSGGRERDTEGDGRRYAEHDGCPGRGVDHFGTGVCSMISLTIWSACRPSISAAGDSTSRCRNVAAARYLISSGMT